jgi:hypothetical protein
MIGVTRLMIWTPKIGSHGSVVQTTTNWKANFYVSLRRAFWDKELPDEQTDTEPATLGHVNETLAADTLKEMTKDDLNATKGSVVDEGNNRKDHGYHDPLVEEGGNLDSDLE